MIGRDSWMRVIRKYTIPTKQQNKLTEDEFRDRGNVADIQIGGEPQKYAIPTKQQNKLTEDEFREKGYLQVYLKVPGGDDDHSTKVMSFIGRVFDLSDEIFLVCDSTTTSVYYTVKDSATYYGPSRRSSEDFEHIRTQEHVVYIPWENILAISYYKYEEIISTK